MAFVLFSAPCGKFILEITVCFEDDLLCFKKRFYRNLGTEFSQALHKMKLALVLMDLFLRIASEFAVVIAGLRLADQAAESRGVEI
jgi:hypothetical protein